MYQIKIGYRTGDSFNSFDTEDTIELTWKNFIVFGAVTLKLYMVQVLKSMFQI